MQPDFNIQTPPHEGDGMFFDVQATLIHLGPLFQSFWAQLGDQLPWHLVPRITCILAGAHCDRVRELANLPDKPGAVGMLLYQLEPELRANEDADDDFVASLWWPKKDLEIISYKLPHVSTTGSPDGEQKLGFLHWEMAVSQEAMGIFREAWNEVKAEKKEEGK